MRSRQVWEEYYSNKHRREFGEKSVWAEAYNESLEGIRGQQIIDLGCGTGLISQRLYRRGHLVTACDFSHNALQTVRVATPGVNTVWCDMRETLPFEPESAGAVIAGLSTHYFSRETTLEIFQKIHQVLMPGGILLLRVNSVQEYLENDQHVAAESLEENYYQMNDGTTKRYFTEPFLRECLQNFTIRDIKEVEFLYGTRIKHTWEAFATKK